MVSSTAPVVKTENGHAVKGVATGDYRLVGFDLDTTGRKLIDEICQIAAYTPNTTYSQYIMPYKNLDFLATRRHLIRTVNTGRYRILKDMQNNKVVKTKSEISALREFLQWLEEQQGDKKDGIILVRYEGSQIIPALLIVALKRHSLLDKFNSLVKGFADCQPLAKTRCDSTISPLTFRTVSKVLLSEQDPKINNAADRASLAYRIVEHLTQGENETGSGDATATQTNLIGAVLEHSHSVEDIENDMASLQVIINRQNTLKPIFGGLLSSRAIALKERRNASQLRRLLSEAMFDYSTLQELWESGKESLVEQLKSKISTAAPEQLEELEKILVEHFEKPVEEREFKPQPRNRRFNNLKKSPKKETKEGEEESKEEQGESTEEPKPVAETNGVKVEEAASS